MNKLLIQDHSSPWKQAWNRLKKDPLAVASLSFIIFLVLIAALAGILSPYDPTQTALGQERQPPSWKHICGTDLFGRDILSRILYGTRITLIVGTIANVIALLIGITLGALAGYFRGWVDDILVWLYSVFWTFPDLLLIIGLTIALPPAGEPQIWKVYVSVGLVGWCGMFRLVRAQFLSLREKEYVQAAMALGLSHTQIILKHILPNTLPHILVILAMGFGGAALAEAGLSFLGLGVQPPQPSLGKMIEESRNYFHTQWWMAAFPGTVILLIVYSFNLFSDGLRDALDPRR